MFAPPVTVAQAKRLRTEAVAAPGCQEVGSAPALGRQTAALSCRVPQGTEVSFRGLFGDAWLTCTLRAPQGGPELVDRAGRWCVAVTQAASGEPTG